MSPRRRTFCFVLIFLSLSDGFVASFPVGPVLTEYCACPGSPPQPVNSLLTVTAGNKVLPECPHVFPSQRFNDVFSFGSYPSGLSINTVATTNFGVPKPPFTTNPLPISPVETITEALAYPDIESVTIIENYPPVTQTIQVEGFAPTANVAEIYQTPITVQIPPKPQLSPFVPSPLPEILPTQNIIQEVYTTKVVPEVYPQIIETEKTTVTSVPVETTALKIPSCDVGCGFGGQQLPVTLQINLASPSFPEPVLGVISQPAYAPIPSCSPSYDMPAPIIVMEKSKSKLKSILPILMLSLFDGGCGNSGGGCSCSQRSPPTPIPFPIVVPTNNPVITRGRSKGKGKPSTDTQS